MYLDLMAEIYLGPRCDTMSKSWASEYLAMKTMIPTTPLFWDKRFHVNHIIYCYDCQEYSDNLRKYYEPQMNLQGRKLGCL